VKPDPSLALAPDALRRLGYDLVDRLVEHLEGLDAKPPIQLGEADELRRAVGTCPDGPSDPQTVFDELFDVLAHGQLATHPRFFARIGSPSNAVSVLADFAAAGVNVFAGSWTGGSGATSVELAVVDWLREGMGMPPGTEGIMVSGGSVGTLTALAVAANERLSSPRPEATAYTSEQAHASLARAWRVLGFAPEHLRVLPGDERHRLTAAATRAAVERDRAAGLTPFCVLASAGTTSTGAVDELDALADLCAQERLWLHVDGAYGGPARLTEAGAAVLRGIERADSLTLDPHKWLFQPYEAGCVLVREPGALERAFSMDGAYLRDTVSGQVELRNRGLQLTRGSRALKLWVSLRVFGLDAFRAAVARGIELAEHAEATLRGRPGWEIISPAQLGIVCFARIRPGLDAAALNALNDQLVRLAVEDGFAAPSSTVIAGRTALRMCTINPRTTAQDIEATIERLEALEPQPV
jgi:glutamate/tyrosine decarboxylase-like PLP-dependent enzyme